MRPGTTKETAIICGAAVLMVGLLTLPFELYAGDIETNAGYLFWIVVAVGTAAVLVLRYRYLSTKKQAQLELANSEQYRELADEYRRLSDLAITTQEHAELKLADITTQLDFLREQIESMKKILKDVE